MSGCHLCGQPAYTADEKPLCRDCLIVAQSEALQTAEPATPEPKARTNRAPRARNKKGAITNG